jgi:microcystin-dependent protein
MRFEFINHLALVSLSESLFPIVPIGLLPRTIRLEHLPIGAQHGVTLAVNVTTSKFVAKFKRFTATAAAATNVSINAATTGISLGAAATGIAIQAAGGGAAHQNMPPTRICNFIMRIL